MDFKTWSPFSCHVISDWTAIAMDADAHLLHQILTPDCLPDETLPVKLTRLLSISIWWNSYRSTSTQAYLKNNNYFFYKDQLILISGSGNPISSPSTAAADSYRLHLHQQRQRITFDFRIGHPDGRASPSHEFMNQ